MKREVEAKSRMKGFLLNNNSTLTSYKLIITEETQKRKCGNFCHYYKGNKCTYKGTDWRECPR